ncbi:WecB/TagA/CpsF family glycosyltransferase [Bacillus sp. ISL-37]|uniref:WecB/TagA/CpsF family glycosyltransferase n=1 Tax=Bacillus sp. ISL-37 TaxID=2819123 RepID=UPI001BE7FAC3|nr:WecB/TagA/CpsF family glycosyltransferase [Bacillus sp. ISL-37]MBT2685999.1 WecB/TagA/CpsF family glycosyltransferase [Bacillus sp. ISL-37]
MKEMLLGVPVSTFTYRQLIDQLFNRMDEGKKSFIVAINPEKIMKAQKDLALLKLLNTADYQIPDGVGLIIASILKGGKLRRRVTGIDMMMTLCQAAADRNKRVFLYGGKPGVAEQAKAGLEELYPEIVITGVMDGYVKDQELITKTINEASPDIVFVALGSPTQEYWIVNNMNHLSAKVFQGVGGSFDVISGRVKRAPAFFQTIGLEWLYRLMKEPKRWKRQIILPVFLYKALKE